MNEPSPGIRQILQADFEKLIDDGHFVTLDALADAIINLESRQQADALCLRRWGFRASELQDLKSLGQLDILTSNRRPSPWREVGKQLGISHVTAQALARRALSNMLGWLTSA